MLRRGHPHKRLAVLARTSAHRHHPVRGGEHGRGDRREADNGDSGERHQQNTLRLRLRECPGEQRKAQKDHKALREDSHDVSVHPPHRGARGHQPEGPRLPAG